MAALGDLVVRLGLDAADFVDGLSKAELTAKQFQVRAVALGNVLGEALVEAGRTAVRLFDTLTTGAAEFKDLEETIGASAESVASLAVAAATAGVSMESVGGSVNKLTKSLVGVDDESKAAGAALTALNLNIEEFKRLDPVQQYEAVGRALGTFADGAQKTAVAQALFGKSGAEQLKVFKALEEAGGAQVILTQKQIETADQYADAQARAGATLRLYAQAAATEALPALTDLVTVTAELVKSFLGVDEAGKQLNGQSSVRSFAEATADALAFVVDTADLVIRIFQLVGTTIAATAAQVAAIASGSIQQAKAIDKEYEADLRRIIDAPTFGARLENMRAMRVEAERLSQLAASDPETKRLLARSRATSAKPQIDYSGAEKEAKAKKQVTDEGLRYVEALRKQVEKTDELTHAEIVFQDILAGRFKGTAQQAGQAIDLADQLDRAKLLKQQAEDEKKFAEERERQSDKIRNQGADLFDATRTSAERYTIELQRMNMLLQEGAITPDTYARALANLQDQFDENIQRSKELERAINSSVEGNFANAFEDFINGTSSAKDAFKSFANSVIQDLLRIESQKLAKQLFGSDSTGAGGIGGLLSSLFGSGSGGGFGTGAGYGNQDYGQYLMATGTNYVPYDGFRATLHKGEAVVPSKYNPAAGGAKGGGIQIVNNLGVQANAREEESQQPDGTTLRRIILDTVNAGVKQGRVPAIESRYGVRAQLPRMGR